MLLNVFPGLKKKKKKERVAVCFCLCWLLKCKRVRFGLLYPSQLAYIHSTVTFASCWEQLPCNCITVLEFRLCNGLQNILQGVTYRRARYKKLLSCRKCQAALNAGYLRCWLWLGSEVPADVCYRPTVEFCFLERWGNLPLKKVSYQSENVTFH